ncbi:MAG: single-stranded-DNA-specific exonuclease RecJ [Holosporales bacterium]|jgi:single-stranded-DNA-specific exonuclease|nr:single-stranded-DNA-specific exonuclease RecJ [Holosporales bacterium]
MHTQISFSGNVWNFFRNDPEEVAEVAMATGVTSLVANIFLNRGISDPSEIKMILDSKLKNTIPDPSLFLDMDKGVERLANAVANRERIMILGDYDVDGITSAYLMVKYLSDVGAPPTYLLPNRFTDGYGVSKRALSMAVDNGVNLIIAVDTGINAINEIHKAKQAGIDSIVIDHHAQVCDALPEAVAIINPHRKDQHEICGSHIKSLCAAGVVLMFIIALQRELKRRKFFSDKLEPNLLDLTGVVALGTLCDVMELKGVNRAIVKRALLDGKYPLGIYQLMQTLNMTKISSAEDLGFFIGPAMNAAGRLGDPTIALKLLLSKNDEEAADIALKLVSMNKKRKEIEKQIVNEAIAMCEAGQLFHNSGICVYGDGWHEGVIGIVAGRLKDKFHKPSFVISFNQDGIGKGSARSVPGAHLGELLASAKNDGLIIEGGGHSQAGGFTISRDQISRFADFVNTNIRADYVPTLDIDCKITTMSNFAQITRDLAVMEPFGVGMEKPLFCIERVRIRDAKRVGNDRSHLMLWLSGERPGKMLKAMIFHCHAKHNLVNHIEKRTDDLFDVAGYINIHERYGKSFFVQDARIA